MPIRTVTTALVALVAAGCGASDEEQVRTTLERFERATAERDVRELCDEVLAARLSTRLQRVGLSCEDAWRIGLEEVRQPELSVQAVRVAGEAAEADVRSTASGQDPASVTVELVKEAGGWRIVDLGAAGPPTPGG